MATLVKPIAGAAMASGVAMAGRNAQGGKSVGLWMRGGRGVENVGRMVVVRASEGEGLGSAADAGGNSVVLEVAALPEEPDTDGIGNVAAPKRKPSPLQRGGSLSGEAAEGKAPAAATLGKASPLLSAGEFNDPRWKNGTWDISMFAKDGITDWDAVIDAGTQFSSPSSLIL